MRPQPDTPAGSIYDAIILGGGPGGSTAATFLARAGQRVLVLEKDRFPRFHIGESLLPYNRRIFEEMGLVPALESAGLVRKFGAQFHSADSNCSMKLSFRQGKWTREESALQVERSRFDELLLNHARASGAEVREGWAVSRFTTQADAVTVQAAANGGSPQEFRGRFLLDASGRGNVTGNQEGLRVVHPHLKKLAVFGHFVGVRLDDGDPAGDTVIVRLAREWFWIIPLGPDKVSVGCVMDQSEFTSMGGSPAEVFHRVVESSKAMTDRMKDAKPVTEIMVTSDFSYRNRRLTGPRLLRIGDAAGFVDPIFSAGVYLAMHSGRLAAKTVTESLKAGDDGSRRFGRYERRVSRAMQAYAEMVEGYYTQPFLELFLQPREKFQIRDAITSLLAGDLDGGWKVWWRLKLFFLLARIQRHFPLVPRLKL